jgi:hypothetical protein
LISADAHEDSQDCWEVAENTPEIHFRTSASTWIQGFKKHWAEHKRLVNVPAAMNQPLIS